MSDARQRIAKLRAERALGEITDREARMIFLNEYQTSYSGNSISSALSHRFVDYHEVGTQEPMLQFFDQSTGALVILPKQSPAADLAGD